jgi:hypothetical protein
MAIKWKKHVIKGFECSANTVLYTENSKQIFPEKKLGGIGPNSYIHVSVSDLYIPTIAMVCLFCCRKIDGPIIGIYKSLIDI